eukprot:101642-Pyramimonas_sp.AAC.1
MQGEASQGEGLRLQEEEEEEEEGQERIAGPASSACSRDVHDQLAEEASYSSAARSVQRDGPVHACGPEGARRSWACDAGVSEHTSSAASSKPD